MSGTRVRGCDHKRAMVFQNAELLPWRSALANVELGLETKGVAAAEHLTRAGVADGLRRVKQLPASSGHEGTLIGFGVWDHAALKGHYLVLRTWRDGHSVQV